MDLPFTQAGLAKLAELRGKRAVVIDPDTKGLRAELREGGRVTFFLLRRIPGGRPMKLKLGALGDLTVKDARKLAAGFITRIASGENIAQLRRQKREEATLGELWEKWLDRAKTRKKSWKEDQRIYHKHLAAWQNRKLSSIAKPDVRALHARWGKDHGHYQANRNLSLLRAMFNQAEDVGYDGANPAARVEPFEEVSRDRFLQPEELPRFFAALAAEPNPVIRDFVWLALFTGERRSKVRAMRWDEISMERAEWRVGNTKQGKPNYVHLAGPALAVLTRRKEAADSEWVLPGHVKGSHLKDVYKNWKAILARAGIADVRLHDLRRTLGSYMAIGGASLNIIGQALGHSRHETTKVYARLTSTAVADEVSGAAKLIEKTGKRKPKKGS